jgi:hypothetical protein
VYPAQLLDGPLLNLVCDARDALRERLRRHRGHALAAAVGRVQHRRDLAREIRPPRIADVGDRPARVTKIIEHGRQRLAQLAVHEMPLPAIWHTGCQAGTTESTILARTAAVRRGQLFAWHDREHRAEESFWCLRAWLSGRAVVPEGLLTDV